MLIPRPAPLPHPLRAPALGLAAGLRLILTGHAALVAARLQRNRRTLPHASPIWTLLNRTIRRFARLMDLLASGRALPAPRCHPSRAPMPGEPAIPVLPRKKPVPRTPGWLIAAIPCEAACFQSQLETLLAQPQAQAILSANPAILRVLAPVRRLLNIPPYVAPRPVTFAPGSGRPILHLSPRAIRRRAYWLLLPTPVAPPAPPLRENAAPA